MKWNYEIQLLMCQVQINTRTDYYKATELRPPAATLSWGQATALIQLFKLSKCLKSNIYDKLSIKTKSEN